MHMRICRYSRYKPGNSEDKIDMIVMSASKLNKSFGVNEVLTDVSFNLNKGDRVGIIGENGAGKSTLLNILAGNMDRDSGEIFIGSNLRVGYLRQSDNFLSDGTVLEEITKTYNKAKDEGLEIYESEITGILNAMAFPESYYDKLIETLSGGEKTRLAFASLLLSKPDIMLLDEPTNHLDIGTLNWLEGYIKSFAGTVVVISHDRYFLDQTINKVFEIRNHRLIAMDGNYSQFAEKKRGLMEAELKKYEIQQKEIKRQEEIIRRFKQHNTEKLVKRAQSREKRLAQLDVVERPDDSQKKMKINFKERFKSGNDVFYAEDLSKSFFDGDHVNKLFEHVELDIKRGERICMVGANGIGKTTLLKILDERIHEDTGYVKKGHNVYIGYYDQEQKDLNENNTVLEEMNSAYKLYGDREMRNILGRFLFGGDKVFQEISSLSGGEKARLSLLKLMLSGSNTLLLDEPTNHLDIWSREVFEDALLDYPGTLFVISHDRYFLSKIPTRILELERDGIVNYAGKYDYYKEKKGAMSSGKQYLKNLGKNAGQNENGHEENVQSGGDAAVNDFGEVITDSQLERRRKKEAEAAERKKARELEKAEQQIEELEQKITALEEEICSEDIMSNHKLLEEKSIMLDNVKQDLQIVYDNWIELHED